MPLEPTSLLPRKLGAKRLGVGSRTASRRETDDPTWPKAHYIAGRAYYREDDVERCARAKQRGRGIPRLVHRKTEVTL